MADPETDAVRAGEWLTTAPNPNSSPFGFNGGQRGWKLHYVQGERAACGITARHGWGLDLHIETRCARCEAALAPSIPGKEPPVEEALSKAERKAQAERCGCFGTDDYCSCQNGPDRQTIEERAALAPSLPGKEEGRG